MSKEPPAPDTPDPEPLRLSAEDLQMIYDKLIEDLGYDPLQDEPDR